ncbi:hypothetical protein [Streptantibioticus silvisoli]|uniref:Tetratricopeptide repeat protein n=1 Tax=Streptantibioticus silvisoli TaxID=2705255 RepID=A0ABT6VRY6_9ACTN|nr:hypothetical protein [Streptantibioticus silvisoli]MDI5961253.1 hypothetical protein [Streptantibioticus silvisoli]
MQIDGVERADRPERRGHLLLVAGAGTTHRRRPAHDPGANLAALAAVPVAVLLGSDVPTDTTHLDGHRGQNALLMRLRTAVATPGPLLIYLTGRLTADRRAHRLHLAMPDTTAGTTRYTALPWQWVLEAVRTRPPGLSTVVVDLAADAAAWQRLRDEPAELTADLNLYGVVAPPGWAVAGPGIPSHYTAHLIDQLRRNPDRPPWPRLHALTVAGADLPPGALVVPAAPELVPHPDHRPQPDERHVPQPDEQHAPAGRAPAAEPPRAAAGEPPPVARTAPPEPVVLSGPVLPAPAALPAVAPEADPADPRPFIWRAAQEGMHQQAADAAAAWEQHAIRTHGLDSLQATEWGEIRADLARTAGDWPLATRLWTAAAQARLRHQPHDTPEVLDAARGAHYCWQHIDDPAEAVATGPELLHVIRQLPALDPRHLSAAQQRLTQMQFTQALG